MAGDGDLRQYLENMTRWLGIENQVQFPGFLGRGEVDQLLSSSSVYVMPSVSESFGISALEAALNGKVKTLRTNSLGPGQQKVCLQSTGIC